jgi:hypothetical protein
MAAPATQCGRAKRARQRLSTRRFALTSIVTFFPVLCSATYAATAPHKVGLGATLTTADGGEIFGFDVDQNGSDGVLASAKTVNSDGELLVSVETFDQNTGKITKSFARNMGTRVSYGVDGIFTGDVGLVTRFFTPTNSPHDAATRTYELMSPVTANKFTGKWTPPIKDLSVLQAAENQSTGTSVLFAIELKNNDNPDLIVSNVAANSFSNVIHLDPNLFGGANGPQLGQYSAANEAVIALSPDAGAVGEPGEAPINVLIDLTTGATTQFNGFNNGMYGAGDVNGLAVDPNTGIGATTTELNAQVEFYNMATQTGVSAVQLPCTDSVDESFSGAEVAVDPVNKLFLVAAPDACDDGNDGAIEVYDEHGKFIETIKGFEGSPVGGPPFVINPGERMGWALATIPGGASFGELQQFFY